MAPTLLDDLINMVNDFAGKDHIWVTILPNLDDSSRLDVIEIFDTSYRYCRSEGYDVYCMKIGQTYEMCHIEDQIFINLDI